MLKISISFQSPTWSSAVISLHKAGPRQPLFCFLSFYISFAFPRVSYKWNHMSYFKCL